MNAKRRKNAQSIIINTSTIPAYIKKREKNSHSNELKNTMFKINVTDKTINTFAFIDDGSSVSLMNESLDVNGEPNPICLRGTGGMERSEQNSHKLIINLTWTNGKCFALDVCIVKSLDLPMQTLKFEKMSQCFSPKSGKA